MEAELASQRHLAGQPRFDAALDMQLEARILADFAQGFPEYGERTINAIKQLHDFAGNAYYVVEFAPYGFTIYDAAFSVALEMNAVAKSPWYGLSYNLIYGGLTHYYVKAAVQPRSGSLFIHTVLDTPLLASDEGMLDLITYSNERAGVIAGYAERRAEERQAQESHAPVAIAPFAYYHYILNHPNGRFSEVSNRWLIRGLDTAPGGHQFNRTGNCGWVSAAIIVYYQRRVRGWNHVAPGGFNRQLVSNIQGTRNCATWGPDIARGIREYIQWRGGTQGVSYWLTPIANPLFIHDRIREDRPVALLGLMDNPDPPTKKGQVMAHAVVVHRAERTVHRNWLGVRSFSNFFFYVHLGWEKTGPNNMDFNNHRMSAASIIIGSIVFF